MRSSSLVFEQQFDKLLPSQSYVKLRFLRFRLILIRMEKLPPTVLVIFGITGDLSRRYLLPALAGICQNSQLGKDFKILGISRRGVDLNEVFGEHEQILTDHSQMLTMDLAKASEYSRLSAKIDEISKSLGGEPQVIFYLSIPPAAVSGIVELLGQTGLNNKHKILLEKPFGFDAVSASELVDHIAKYFKEEQVYRIDHYLAKQMVQNITIYLSQNIWLKEVANRQFVEKIEIDALESIGIEGRAAFYESTGALRDFIQSHLLQLAALVLMEPCEDVTDFEELPPRRLAALRSMEPIGEEVCVRYAVRGQYEGYEQDAGNPGSKVETFVSLPIYSSSPRWLGVPIVLTTGKKLDQKLTEIRIHFKQDNPADAKMLSMQIQPKQHIELTKWLQTKNIPQDFKQPASSLPDAYQQVLADAMRSNHGLFASSDEVLASWRILQPLQSYWYMHNNLLIYKPGSSATEILSQKEN